VWRFPSSSPNLDDRSRNHGFLRADRRQRWLTPTFDVNPLPDRVRELKTWVAEEAEPKAMVEALVTALLYLWFAPPRARDILRDADA